MRPANIEVHIEELVLHGFASGDRHRIGEAVERELARLFAEQGVPHSVMQGAEMARLDGGAFSVAESFRAEVIGNQVAQALHEGLNR